MDKVLELLLGRPEMMLPVVKEYINKFKPIAYGLAQEVAEVLKDYSNNTEYPTVKAKIKKNLFDTYVAAGFTEEQALVLMMNDNVSLTKNMEQLGSCAKKTK